MDDTNNNLTPEEVARRAEIKRLADERDARLEEERKEAERLASRPKGVTIGDAPETDEDRAELDEISKTTFFDYSAFSAERQEHLRDIREAYAAGKFKEYATAAMNEAAEIYRTDGVDEVVKAQLYFMAGAEKLKSKKGKETAAAERFIALATGDFAFFVTSEVEDPAQQEELYKFLRTASARAAKNLYNPPKINPPRANEIGYMTDPFNKALASEKGKVHEHTDPNSQIQRYRSIDINFASAEMRKKGEIAKGVALISYENSGDVPANIDHVDNLIISVTSELFLANSVDDHKVHATAQQIWRTAHGYEPTDRTKYATNNQIREYIDRLKKLKTTTITLLASKDSTTNFFLDHTDGVEKTPTALHYTPLQIGDILETNDREGRLDATIIIYAPSQHYLRSIRFGGRMLVPVKYLKTPPGMRASKNSENIKLYLLREIMFMKNKTYARNNQIALDTLYTSCRIELSKDAAARREETRTTRDIIEKLLAGWEKTGFIKSWKPYTNKGNARRIAGYKITL